MQTNRYLVAWAMLGAALGVAGCGTPAKIPDAPEVPRISALAGRAVRLDVQFDQRFRVDRGEYGEKFEVRPYDFERELRHYVIVEDVERIYQTRPMLRAIEQAIAEALVQAGARVVADGEPADLALHARMVFGPTPAPCYFKLDPGKSLAVGIASFGLAPDFFEIHADYTLELRLAQADRVLLEERFVADEFLPHSASPFNLKQRGQMAQKAREYCVDV
jgi:hypothetical protein